MKNQSYNVLIIDDCQADHMLYREYLNLDKNCSYQFQHAYNGEEGLNLYHPATTDCVILDFRLPDIDGLEVLRQLVAKYDTVPAVMMTGDGNETVAVTAMQNGSNDYVPKRVLTPEAIQRAIERTAERSQMIKRMEAYKRELERSNEDLERFANVVAHDLKSPLRAITQHLKLLSEQNHATLDAKSLKSIQFAIDGSERMRALIDALFAFSKAGFEKNPPSALNCNTVCNAAKSNLASNIEDTKAIVTIDTLPNLTGDKMQLMQLFQNLIGNALKFCKTTPQIHISAVQDGGRWIFSVRDNGIGIAPGNQEKIFSIFKRLHSQNEYPGCGVGLAICERVVKNHGGTIWVESELGKGATFFFSLPSEAAIEKAA